jgi:hypothetical protein
MQYYSFVNAFLLFMNEGYDEELLVHSTLFCHHFRSLTFHANNFLLTLAQFFGRVENEQGFTASVHGISALSWHLVNEFINFTAQIT